MLAATITKALDLDPLEVPHAKIARSLFDDTVDPLNPDANDMPANAVASEIGQKVNGENGSMVAINDAEAGAVLNIENEVKSNAIVDVEFADDDNSNVNVDFADDDKENWVGENVRTIALSQSVSNNEKMLSASRSR